MINLKFNTKIYKKKAIEKTISAYSHLAKFKSENNKSYVKVKIDCIESTVKDVLADEFSNYALGMMVKCL